ncbi:hypothetical protein WME76_00970 [Sorangium sp. So ce119]|uniref:hypothetical protein n=1 Tax=Sorangium sp. So ce119 TaxID=3133279 RepID=UPI003F6361EA
MLSGLLLGFVVRRGPRSPAQLGDLQRYVAAQRGKLLSVATAILTFLIIPGLAAFASAWAYRARSEAAASTYLRTQAGPLLGVMLIATLMGLVVGRSLFLERAPEEPEIRRLRFFGLAIAIVVPFAAGLFGFVATDASLFLALFMCFLFGIFPAMTLLPASGSAASSGSSSASSSTSASSSSYSSPSYSSSSSSSSSSSGYGGGGGSFGGGGASSSW